MTITGAGARATRVVGVGGELPFDDRIFDILPGATATITGLTITGGKAGAFFGGGVQNFGDLTFDKVSVKNNTSDLGGGIYAEGGKLNLTDSTMSGNSATYGGGILTQGNGTVNITNSTISGNQAAIIGGGVLASDGPLMHILNSTIVSNTSGQPGGGIVTGFGATALVKNTVVTNNTLDNCDTAQFGGTISSQGNNISSDDSCPFTKPTDKQNTNPRLGPLRNNGAFEKRNSPPVARNDSYRGVEDRTLRVPARRGVLRNDTDADRDRLSARLVSRPKKGKLALRPNGAFTYKPKKNFNGTIRFVYRASDGRGGSDTARVTLRIKARPR